MNPSNNTPKQVKEWLELVYTFIKKLAAPIYLIVTQNWEHSFYLYFLTRNTSVSALLDYIAGLKKMP
jgi:hypothetical protein